MNNRTKLLLIDDDEEDFIITRDLIGEIRGERKYEIEWVSTYDAALQAIISRKHDAYLVDYNLGVESGLDLIREVQKEGLHAPFILLTGQSTAEIDEEAMHAGASDFLVKGNLSSGELERTIRYSIRHIGNLSEIRFLNTELENRVKERTAQLAKTVDILEETNSNLKVALEEKVAAEKLTVIALEKEKTLNELKSRFVSMASHEFRTPLSTILTSIQLLSRYNEMQDKVNSEKHLLRIRSSITHLTDLLNDFLSIEKLEAGKILSSPELFDFFELVNEATEEFRSMAKEGQEIYLEQYNEGGPKLVLLDKRHIKNLLFNLLSNAIKYSAINSEIKVTTFSRQNEIMIEINDHGIGIPEDEQSQLFERFFRAKNATNIQGTGLGLNIVKKYLDLMGGKISFVSNPEEGTTFTVVLAVQ
ncbi:hypothetical protein BH09BAC5_BH09BAC5_00400 [soil metagenome]